MFIAMDEQGNLIQATECVSDRKQYCPVCKEDLIFKNGLINQPHFSHKKTSRCQTFSEGESVEHMEGKLLLYKWFLKEKLTVYLEAFLPGLNQRPDVLIEYDGAKIAIEYQCSPISKEIIKARTNGYLKNKYDVIWILGDKLKVTDKVAQTHFTYLTEWESNRFHLVQLDRTDKKIEVLTDFTSDYEKILFTKKVIDFSCTSAEVVNKMRSKQSVQGLIQKTSQNTRNKQKRRLYQMSHYQSNKGRRFFELMYMYGLTVDSLPVYIYGIVSHEWMIVTLSFQWKLIVLLWLETCEPYHVITKKSLIRKIGEWAIKKEIVFQCIPNANTTAMYRPIFEFMEVLCLDSIMKHVGDEKWVRKNRLSVMAKNE